MRCNEPRIDHHGQRASRRRSLIGEIEMKGAIRPSSGPSGHLLPEGEGPGISKFRICLFIVLLVCLATQLPQPLTGSDRPAVAALDSIGITVSDIDRSVDFFSKILSFEKVSDIEIAGSEYERLQ